VLAPRAAILHACPHLPELPSASGANRETGRLAQAALSPQDALLAPHRTASAAPTCVSRLDPATASSALEASPVVPAALLLREAAIANGCDLPLRISKVVATLPANIFADHEARRFGGKMLRTARAMIRLLEIDVGHLYSDFTDN
jgi:hypothetical protein